MKEQWVACVDGVCYGFFKSRQAAWNFVAIEFPVACSQSNYKTFPFLGI